MTILWIALGGALGSAARFIVSQWLGKLAGAAPVGILGVNVLGSFAMGLAAAVLFARTDASRATPFLITGFLGGFTTFSAFSLDAVRLWEEAKFAALAYIVASVILSILALLAGLAAGRSLT